MTIAGWIGFAILAVVFLIGGATVFISLETKMGKIAVLIVTVVLILALLFGMRWYFQNTASGQRALIDSKSELNNGIDRTVTVYTANGEIIAQYSGKIDIEGNDGGYVLFDFDGKRYIYYNCFVESIADIS